MPEPSVRWTASRRPHSAKWVKTSTFSPAAYTDSTISSRRVSLPDRPASGRSSAWYAVGWLQICFERGDGGEDRTLLGLLPRLRRGDEPVEHGLVQTDLLGGHRAVVELVDAVGQLAGDVGLGLRPAEHEDAVERPQRGLTLARQLGDERRSERRRGPGW